MSNGVLNPLRNSSWSVAMNFRNLAILSSLVCFALAVTWILAPNTLLTVWGFEFSYSAGLVGRRAAALFAGIGVMLFTARDAKPSSARSALVSGFVVGCVALAALGIFEFANGHAGPGILSAVLVEIALAMAFLYVARTQPPHPKEQSEQLARRGHTAARFRLAASAACRTAPTLGVIEKAMNKRPLQIAMCTLGVVPVVTGGLTMLGLSDPIYSSSGIPANALLDSNLRFFGGLWLVLGLAVYWLVPRIEKETALFRALWLMIFVGGIGRLLSMVFLGLPPLPFVGFTVLEIVGAPAFIVWQSRLTK